MGSLSTITGIAWETNSIAYIYRAIKLVSLKLVARVLSAFMKKHHGIATAIVIRLYPKVIYTFFCMLTSLTLCQYIYLTSLTLCQDIYGTGTGAY
jgi:hypothetical protein